MIAKDDIVIRKAILHILDTNRGECILSNTLLDPGPDLHDFIRNHIYKIVSSDDTKNCEFNPEASPIYSILETWDESDDASFIETSQAIANKLYIAMGEGLDIPAADLLFVTFQAEGTIYLALLKMKVIPMKLLHRILKVLILIVMILTFLSSILELLNQEPFFPQQLQEFLKL